MEYHKFIKKLKKHNIELFDYDKRKLYYQLNNRVLNGGGCVNFFKCDNKKYILEYYKKNKINIDFINSNYKKI